MKKNTKSVQILIQRWKALKVLNNSNLKTMSWELSLTKTSDIGFHKCRKVLNLDGCMITNQTRRPWPNTLQLIIKALPIIFSTRRQCHLEEWRLWSLSLFEESTNQGMLQQTLILLINALSWTWQISGRLEARHTRSYTDTIQVMLEDSRKSRLKICLKKSQIRFSFELSWACFQRTSLELIWSSST